MNASIDIRMANLAKLPEEKYTRMLEIIQQKTSEAYPETIVRVRKSASITEISVFGLGKEGKEEVLAFLNALFDDGSAFDELNDEYY